jgi:outer membrane receptor protein involved in Fe transport
VRQELTFSLGAHTLEAGGEVHDLTTALALVITGDRNPAAANGSSVQGGAGLPDSIDERRPSTRAGAWLADTWRLGSRASIEGGVRLDHTSVNHQVTLSPRLSGVFTLTPRTTLKATAGLYRQSPGYEKLAQSDYLLDFTSSATRTLKSEQASLASAGLEHHTQGGLTARVEGYFKHFSQLLVGALEDEPTRLTRVSQYEFPVAFASSVPADPIITSTPTNDGAGRAYGFDMFVSRLATPGRLRGWASYTWGKAERQAYGRTYPFEYDRRHAVTAVVSYQLTSKWELASTTRWATGFARSVPIGLRVAATPDADDLDHDSNVTELVPARDADGRLIYAVDFGGVANLNRGRLPDFARVDLRLTWKSAGRWEIYFEVINALNRKNASTLTPKLAYDPTSDRPKIVQVPDQGFPLLPTFGIRCRF